LAATISSTSTRITISGSYKAFDSTTGSTSTVIQYSTGDAPASGDAGRFLMWKNGSDTSDWEIRYIESATATTVTVGDGGFSSSPASGEDFVISTNLADVETAEPVACTSSGSSYSFNGRDFALDTGAFLADVNKSLVTEATQTGTGFIATYPVADNCAVQFGRLIGGEANDSTETIEGCNLIFEVANNTLMFTNQGSVNTAGPVLNFYGCLIESFDNGNSPFIRSPGPMRLIGSICDGPMGGRLYSAGSELVDTRFSGNLSGGIAWSLGGTFTRPINNAFFFQNNTAIKAFQDFTGVFSNTKFADSNTNIIDSGGATASLLFTFIDCTTFTDGKITATKGQYKQAKSINYTLADSSGTGLTGAKVAVYDNTATIQDAIATSTAGAVDQIDAVFFDRPHGSTSTDKSPFDIRIRKYDYQYQDFQSAVSEPIKQEFRIPSNAVTVLSEVAAGALTGIAIDFGAKTLTLTESHTLSEIYDYTQSQMALDANMDEVEFLKSGDGNVFTFNNDWDLILGASGDITSGTGKTIVFGGTGKLYLNDAGNTIDGLTVTGDIDLGALVTPITDVTAGAVDFSVAGTYSIDGCTFDEATNSSGGAVTLNLTNGASVTTNTGPSITLASPVDITAPNILTGSRVQLYNVTKDAELDNSVVSGSYSFTVNLAGASIDDGDTVRLRATYQSGVTAKAELETSGVISASGLSFVNTQVDNDVYNAYGVDGSTITEFSFDSGNIEVDINDSDNTTEIQRLACWEAYFETTEQGIRDFFGCIDWESLNSIQIVTSMCDLTLDNTKASPLLMTGGRLYRSDGATVISSTSNSIQIDYEPVYIGNADDITDIKATIDTNLDATVSSRATQTSVDNLPSSVPTVEEIVDGVFDEIV
jgi:hypothetical protein